MMPHKKNAAWAGLESSPTYTASTQGMADEMAVTSQEQALGGKGLAGRQAGL